MGGYSPVLAMDEGEMVAVIAVTGGIFLAILGILAGTVKCIVRAKMQETTRREIAAYVAEGSITQEEGERLLRASPRDRA
jgi:hypothetical protein